VKTKNLRLLPICPKMSYDIWIEKCDCKKKKILLFKDNCSAHPVLENLENIKTGVPPRKHYKLLQPIAH
jgi:hypothetical protein